MTRSNRPAPGRRAGQELRAAVAEDRDAGGGGLGRFRGGAASTLGGGCLFCFFVHPGTQK